MMAALRKRTTFSNPHSLRARPKQTRDRNVRIDAISPARCGVPTPTCDRNESLFLRVAVRREQEDMSNSKLFAVVGILLASASGAVASPMLRLGGADPNIVQAQYGNCANWHRQCARLWGGGTERWNECMGQPQALADCGRGGYAGGGYAQGTDLCGNWHQQCARLYGRSPAYRDCMRQPQALADCGRY